MIKRGQNSIYAGLLFGRQEACFDGLGASSAWAEEENVGKYFYVSDKFSQKLSMDLYVG